MFTKHEQRVINAVENVAMRLEFIAPHARTATTTTKRSFFDYL